MLEFEIHRDKGLRLSIFTLYEVMVFTINVSQVSLTELIIS
jgi:hypothetical protein